MVDMEPIQVQVYFLIYSVVNLHPEHNSLNVQKEVSVTLEVVVGIVVREVVAVIK
jgi:hypothetical protein